MAEHTSKVGQRADSFSVNDDPHEKYYESGVPVLSNTEIGKVVDKEVKYYTLSCDECERKAWYNEMAEPICPECSAIIGGETEVRDSQLMRDAKAAGRVTKTN